MTSLALATRCANHLWQVFLADPWMAGGRPQAAPGRLMGGSLRSAPPTPSTKLPERLVTHDQPRVPSILRVLHLASSSLRTGRSPPIRRPLSNANPRCGGVSDPARFGGQNRAAGARRPPRTPKKREKSALQGHFSPFFPRLGRFSYCNFRQTDFNHRVHVIGRTSCWYFR
jgi:hypothetical protein